MFARYRVHVVVLAAALLVAMVSLTGLASAARAPAAQAKRLSGTVLAGGEPIEASRVTLYESGRRAPTRLGSDTTDERGTFRIKYGSLRDGAVMYAVAAGGRTSAREALRLMAVADPANASPTRLTINELSTVASVYSLSRFLNGSRLAGVSPGLPNAAATVPGLVRPASGKVGSEIANSPNGTDTDSLAALGTLADLLAGCTAARDWIARGCSPRQSHHGAGCRETPSTRHTRSPSTR